jgi:hypothetical protein
MTDQCRNGNVRPAQPVEVQQNALRILQLIELMTVLVPHALDPEYRCDGDGVGIRPAGRRRPLPNQERDIVDAPAHIGHRRRKRVVGPDQEHRCAEHRLVGDRLRKEKVRIRQLGLRERRDTRQIGTGRTGVGKRLLRKMDKVRLPVIRAADLERGDAGGGKSRGGRRDRPGLAD